MLHIITKKFTPLHSLLFKMEFPWPRREWQIPVIIQPYPGHLAPPLLPLLPSAPPPFPHTHTPLPASPTTRIAPFSSFSVALRNVVGSQGSRAFRVHYEYVLIAVLKQSEHDFKFVLLPKFPFAVSGRASHVSCWFTIVRQ